MFNSKKVKALEKEVAELKDRLIKSQDYILSRLEVVEKDNTKINDRLDKHKLRMNFYNETVSTISQDYKDLFKGICMTDAKSKVAQTELELKWERDKLLKGNIIARKGADIIDQRKAVYDAMLIAEKQESADYEKLKEQLKAFDWILEKINEKN